MIPFTHPADDHVSREGVDLEAVSRRHVLLGGGLDPGKRRLGLAACAAPDGRRLALDDLGGGQHVLEGGRRVHLDADVTLRQLAGLDDDGAARVHAVVRLDGLLDRQSVRLHDVAAARRDHLAVAHPVDRGRGLGRHLAPHLEVLV